MKNIRYNFGNAATLPPVGVVELSTVEEEAEEKLYKMRFDDLMLSAAGIFMMVRWKLLQFLWMRFEDNIMW